MKNLAKWSVQLSLLIGAIALIAMLIQGPGYKAGWWDLGTSFRSVFPKVVIGGGVAILLGTLGFFGSKLGGDKFNMLGLLGIAMGVSAAIVPISIKKTAESLPLIHDITTDTQNPPEFVAIAPLRVDASNPVSYDPAISAQQKEAYPDITTIEISAECEDVFPASIKSIEKLGWELVAADEASGRIEATESTAWFGFKDDVVIRIAPFGLKTLVDVRSKSRIGKSDLGANAKRIRKFRDTLLQQFGATEELGSC